MVSAESFLRKKAAPILWKILVFAMLCFPRILSMPKIILLAGLLIISLLLYSRIRINKNLKIYAALTVALTLFRCLVGFIYGNATASFISDIRLNIVYTLCFIFIIGKLSSEKYFFPATARMVDWANIYIGVFNLILVAAFYLRFNVSFLFPLDATSAVGMHEGYSHIVTTNLSMSIITFPVALFLARNKKTKGKDLKNMRFLGVCLCGIAMILSGRRILWLVFGLAVFINIIVTSKDPIKLIRKILIVLVLLGIFTYVANRTGLLSLDGIINRFMEAFGKGESGETERLDQAGYLLQGFRTHPLIGSGQGAVIQDFARSETTPWSFELSYHVILFQSGIIGMLLFLLSIFYLWRMIHQVKQYNKAVYRSCTITLILALVANATNPYIGSSFDFILFVFLPAALAAGYLHNTNHLLPAAIKEFIPGKEFV